MDDTENFSGFAWEGVPYPPVPNEDRYTRLAEAFLAIPATPDSRLQRDIWNRLNALNQKKLKALRKQAMVRAKREQRAAERRQAVEAMAFADGESIRVKGQRRRRVGERIRTKFAAWCEWYKESLVPFIGRLLVYVSTLMWCHTWAEKGRNGFPTKLGFIMP